MVIREVAGIQDLNAGVVLAIEGRNRGRAAGSLGVQGRVKPKAKMVICTGANGGFELALWKGPPKTTGAGALPGAMANVLNTEYADETSVASAVLVGLNVALIPGNTKRSLGDLEDKKGEVRIRGKPLYEDFHSVNEPGRLDPDGSARVG